MFKRMFHLLLAVLMVVVVVVGPMTATVEAAEESKWTLVEFTWGEVLADKNIREHKEYALVGSGNGADAFAKLAPKDDLYAPRFEVVAKELAEQAKEDKRLDGISFVQIKEEPKEFTFKTGTENQENNQADFTNICFNGKDVAKVDGGTVFIILTWSLAYYEAKPEEGDAELYLYYHDGCMDGEGAKRELCAGCGLVTIHDMLSFCGHSSCVDANHAPAVCGVEGHKACYDRHGAARCGLKGHHVCTGIHADAACNTKKHYVCDGKKHVPCAGCGMLQCDEEYKKSEHIAACGSHYACASGYKAEDHKKLDCGHYACAAGNHVKADCGKHYQCAAGYKAENHALADCGAHHVCAGGNHGLCACGKAVCNGEDHGMCA